MDAWQTVAQIALMLAGVPLAVRGLWREWDAILRPIGDPEKVLKFFRGFRMSIIGLSLIGLGAGWLWDQTWLIVLSAAIGFEETIESSIDIFAMTRGKDFRIGPASREAKATQRPTDR
ncbi:MAG: hypothetical protein WD904_01235 [Dehalococcoidia bacterium]